MYSVINRNPDIHVQGFHNYSDTFRLFNRYHQLKYDAKNPWIVNENIINIVSRIYPSLDSIDAGGKYLN